MTDTWNVSLQPVRPEELPDFAANLQNAFSIAVRETFGTTEPVPSDEELKHSFAAKGAHVLHVVLQGRRVGGVVVVIDEKTQHNTLELFFISPEQHSRGLGFAAWKAVENAYPDTVTWTTFTPYFEQRNIHFYVNKCGFHIVEFFHAGHMDPHSLPSPNEAASDPGTETYFRFEKVMKRPAPAQDAALL